MGKSEMCDYKRIRACVCALYPIDPLQCALPFKPLLSVSFQSAWAPYPWTGALDEVRHCHMCSQVREWTVWLHWDTQMGSVEWLQVGCPCAVPGLCDTVCTWL